MLVRGRAVECVVLGVLVLLLSGCGQAGYRRVSLTPAAPSSLGGVPPEETVLRVAVAAMISPRSAAHGYTDLAAYLEERLGMPVILVQRGTYAESNELLRTRQVDLGFVCTGAYVRGQADFGMALLAVPSIRGQSTYRSHLIVPGNSSARTVADLRGRSFAFTDPMSLSGYLVAGEFLGAVGASAEGFFARTSFTYSHDKSVRAVAEGWVDGAAVDGLIHDMMLDTGLIAAGSTRVIWTSQAFGAPPVVVHPDLTPELRWRLQEVLLGMHEDEEGRRTLRLLGIERFVYPDDGLYDSAREVALTGWGPG